MLTPHTCRWSFAVVVAALALACTAVVAQEPATAPATPQLITPSTSPAVSATSMPAETPLVTVGQTTLTAGDIDSIMAGAPAMPEGRKAQIIQMLLNRLVARDIVGYFVKTGNLKADEAKIAERMDMIAKEAQKTNITPQQLMDQLHINKENIATDLAMTDYVQSLVTDEKLAEYVKAHPKYFDGTQLKVSHILITAGPFAPTAEQLEAKKKLEDVRAEIESGKISFADAAKKYSQDTGSKDKGGELGEWIGFDLESLAPGFVVAAFNTEKGQVSPVSRTEFGWHIVKVDDIKPGEVKQAETQPSTETLSKAKQAVLSELNAKLLLFSAGEVPITYHPAMQKIIEALKLAEAEQMMPAPGGEPAPTTMPAPAPAN